MKGHPIPELGDQFSPRRPGSGLDSYEGGLQEAGVWGQLNRESKGYRTCMMSCYITQLVRRSPRTVLLKSLVWPYMCTCSGQFVSLSYQFRCWTEL